MLLQKLYVMSKVILVFIGINFICFSLVGFAEQHDLPLELIEKRDESISTANTTTSDTEILSDLQADSLAPTINLPVQKTIKEIVFTGLKFIETENAEIYVKLNVGDALDKNLVKESVLALYQTGFFKRVDISYGKGKLFIEVEENPVINEFTFEGNELVPKEAIEEIVKKQKLSSGNLFSDRVLDSFLYELKNTYHANGYYGSDFISEVEKLNTSSIKIKIKIIENEAAKLHSISFVGNQIYKDTELLDLLTSKIGGKYSAYAIDSDLAILNHYYKDKGFAKFRIEDKIVKVSDDYTQIFINVKLNEGEIYKYGKINIEGNLVLSKDMITNLINIKPQDYYSLTQVTETVKKIKSLYVKEGFSFANIRQSAEFNDQKQLANITFRIVPNKKVYVRKIIFVGNNRTRDDVLRREFRQYENSLYNLDLINLSINRIRRMGLFSSVEKSIERISEDEVNLIINLKEQQSTGSFNAGLTYSQQVGLSYNISIKERNIFGSGITTDINLSQGKSKNTLNLGLTNPYFTKEGISQSMRIYFSELKASEIGVSSYTLNNAGFRVGFGIPKSELSKIDLNLTLDQTRIICGSSFTLCNDYIKEHDSVINSLILGIGYSINSTNAFYFPTDGDRLQISLINYLSEQLPLYKVITSYSRYFPLHKYITASINSKLDTVGTYSEDSVPFYQHYYVGGIRTVRGYASNSIGEKYNTDEHGSTSPKGGAARAIIKGAFVLPVPFVKDSSNLRLSLFYDSGMVYKSFSAIDLGKLKASYGLGLSWISILGPISFNIANPINSSSEDEYQSFQFSIGVLI